MYIMNFIFSDIFHYTKKLVKNRFSDADRKKITDFRFLIYTPKKHNKNINDLFQCLLTRQIPKARIYISVTIIIIKNGDYNKIYPQCRMSILFSGPKMGNIFCQAMYGPILVR